ncbi:FecR family protein [Novosphingobium lindaniclasticum]|uniref:FecR family protein n=1 Tax=Novosphingobium lindaniclasticum TaxID=1329895 RepID=UPI00240919AE|nr:FecR domain-containing protein [Novosphingobium lindaniclasticum]
MSAAMSQDRFQEASQWVARLHAEDRSEADDRAFRQWLEGDPRNAGRFEHASAVWDAVGGVRDDIVRVPLRPAVLERRQVLAGLAAVALTGTGVVALSSGKAQAIETGIGEQKRITLPDGSHLFVDTATSLRFRTSWTQRLLSLAHGRVHLDIASGSLPFVVSAGQSELVATRGKFDVERAAEDLAFVAIDGVATIRGSRENDLRLASGERFRSGSAGTGRDRPDMRDMSAWQSGRLAFRDETLASAAAQMNRYSPQKLVVTDPQVSSLRISGVYTVGDNVRFARSVEELLPVQLAVSGDRIVIAR